MKKYVIVKFHQITEAKFDEIIAYLHEVSIAQNVYAAGWKELSDKDSCILNYSAIYASGEQDQYFEDIPRITAREFYNLYVRKPWHQEL